jgi:hypothetical protein
MNRWRVRSKRRFGEHHDLRAKLVDAEPFR